MKKILLIGPYNKKYRTGQYLAPPLGIYRIKSYIEKNNLAQVDVVDPTLNINELYIKLKTIQYDIIGHSVLHSTIKNDLKIIFQSHKLQKKALQIAGGQGATFNYNTILENTPINIIVKGFGEESLSKIITESMNSSKPDNNSKIDLKNDPKKYETIQGIYIKDKNNNIISNTLTEMCFEKFRDISLSIDFEKIPYEKYWNNITKRYDEKHLKITKNQGMGKTVRLITSNYCPLGCSFCSSTNFLKTENGTKHRFISLEPTDIITLLNNAIRTHPNLEAIYFNDDNFLLNKSRTIELCDLLENNIELHDKKNISKRKYSDINMMCMGRVDNVDDNILKKMKQAGFKIIFYGVETFSSNLAIKIKKTRNNNYEKIAHDAILSTINAGITPQISLMLFMPESKESDIEITINNSVDLMEKGAIITVFPYIEAYTGCDMIKKHKSTYSDFIINNKKFHISNILLPDSKKILDLAKKSIINKEILNETYKNIFGENIPQPIDTLNLFKAIYNILKKDTTRIDNLLLNYVNNYI